MALYKQIPAKLSMIRYLHILPSHAPETGALVPLSIDICACAARLLKNGEDEFHGYEMAKQLSVAADRPSLAAYGTLYRALARLVDMGLLTSRSEAVASGRRQPPAPSSLHAHA